jgi:hypothetical protein
MQLDNVANYERKTNTIEGNSKDIDKLSNSNQKVIYIKAPNKNSKL